MRESPKVCQFCRDRSPRGFCELAGISAPPHRAEITVSRYKPRQIIFHEGNPPLAAYCIRSGVVKLYKTGRNGEHLIIRLPGTGRLLGYRAVLGQEPYAATAEALGAVELCMLPRRYFLDLLRDSPEFCRRLLVMMATELRASEERTMALAHDSVRVRTVGLLLSFLEETSTTFKAGDPVHVPLQRCEMAQMVGTSPETLSRTLRKLAQEGALRVTRSEILVQSPQILRTIGLSDSP